jgi:dTDP-4-amino-4,6-dideoxygalactose transaminase
MSDLQASLGLIQLKKIERFLKIRKKYAQIYNEAFSDTPEIIIPSSKRGISPAYHLYVIKVKKEDLIVKRDVLITALWAENIGVGVHFKALHLHTYYRQKYGFKKGDFPVASDMSERVISLPLYPAMTEKDVRDVICAVKKVIACYRKRKLRRIYSCI